MSWWVFIIFVFRWRILKFYILKSIARKLIGQEPTTLVWQKLVNLINTDGNYPFSMMINHVTAFSGLFQIFTDITQILKFFGDKIKNPVQYLIRWLSRTVWSSRFYPILFYTGLGFEKILLFQKFSEFDKSEPKSKHLTNNPTVTLTSGLNLQLAINTQVNLQLQ